MAEQIETLDELVEFMLTMAGHVGAVEPEQADEIRLALTRLAMAEADHAAALAALAVENERGA